MAARPTYQTITDDLLDITVRIKREAGVSHAQIQCVIDRFASQERWQERTGGIGFPLVEDIPQDARGPFMAALAELAPEQGKTGASDRRVPVTEIWPSRIS